MVLQRDTKVKIWGWGPAGEKVAIELMNRTYNIVVNAKSEWNIQLPKLKAGGP